MTAKSIFLLACLALVPQREVASQGYTDVLYAAQCPFSLELPPEYGSFVSSNGKLFYMPTLSKIAAPYMNQGTYRANYSVISVDNTYEMQNLRVWVTCWRGTRVYTNGTTRILTKYTEVGWSGNLVQRESGGGQYCDEYDPDDPFCQGYGGGSGSGQESGNPSSGGGGGGSGANCSEAYIYLEVDEGSGWEVVWEGYATICEE